MNDNNGFSMIELLTAITILAILSVLAIGSVQLLLDKSGDYYIRVYGRNSSCDCETRSKCSAAGCQTRKECWYY